MELYIVDDWHISLSRMVNKVIDNLLCFLSVYFTNLMKVIFLLSLQFPVWIIVVWKLIQIIKPTALECGVTSISFTLTLVLKKVSQGHYNELKEIECLDKESGPKITLLYFY